MIRRTCCFTGHRQIAPEDRERLKEFLIEAVKEAIRRGVDTFVTGGALGFDTLAALTVLEAQRVLPHLRLVLALPCEDQTKYWRERDVELYRRIRRQADEVQVLSPSYFNGCMQARNRYMVNRSALCVAYLVGDGGGGTGYTVNYAAQKGLTIISYQREGALCRIH